MNGPVKEALGLDVTHDILASTVYNCLIEDFMKPVTNIGMNQIYQIVIIKTKIR